MDVQSQPYGFFYTIYISQEILIGQFQIDYVRLYYSIHEIYDNSLQIVLAISADGPNRTIPNAPTKRGRLLPYDVQLNHTILYLKSMNFVINILNVL